MIIQLHNSGFTNEHIFLILQTPRLDPNCNIGGSTNIEDYYNPSMVDDPWRNMAPVIVSQTSKF